MRISLSIAALSLLAACNQGVANRPPVTEAEALRIAEAVEADYTSGDASKILSHYADDAIAFDPAHVEPTSDRKTLERWTRDFVSMKPGDYTVTNRRIQVTGPDNFVSFGIARMTVQAGQARPQVGVRFGQTYSRGKDGQWKIINEHMSMPPTPPGQPAQ